MKCKECGKAISEERQRRHAVYCSTKCSNAHFSTRYKELNERRHLSTSTVGAMHELKVSIDLLNRSYAVFRALSPSCPSDLVILKDGRLQICH